ncbi:hypothetical protein V1478_003833 [Vespula squamosa]|uniref:Uncharacterized protein n=1 Tax=Vespula squamosa TaxID=30214 RepID=A0ABD2BN01_VESSQ
MQPFARSHHLEVAASGDPRVNGGSTFYTITTSIIKKSKQRGDLHLTRIQVSNTKIVVPSVIAYSRTA